MLCLHHMQRQFWGELPLLFCMSWWAAPRTSVLCNGGYFWSIPRKMCKTSPSLSKQGIFESSGVSDPRHNTKFQSSLTYKISDKTKDMYISKEQRAIFWPSCTVCLRALSASEKLRTFWVSVTMPSGSSSPSSSLWMLPRELLFPARIPCWLKLGDKLCLPSPGTSSSSWNVTPLYTHLTSFILSLKVEQLW